ncbi:MAG: Ig-like domain-containing protein [Bacteroidales bacterium]|jgi:hypothetical protein|nr:Ig-like domain-containing protein [Bacteroidales bacterium]
MNRKLQLFLTICVSLLVTTLVLSCTKDDGSKSIKLNTPTVSLLAGSKSQIVISPNVDGCTFESRNPTIASVSSTGEISGNMVGETSISITNSQKKFNAACNVTVSPQYHMYREPCLNFTASIADVKSYEERKLITESTTSLGYQGENSNIAIVLYAFDNKILKSASVLIPCTSSNTTLLANFIKERYLITADDNTVYFLNDDRTVGGGISVYTYENVSYYLVLYFAYSSDSESKAYNKFPVDISVQYNEYVKNQLLEINKMRYN